MAFWSSAKLRANLSSIVTPSRPDRIQSASYELCVGDEIYVTPHAQHPNAQCVTKQRLAARESVAIPSGQFAYLLTEETVTIPYNAVGWISIKSRPKFRGLVNVSGFHVDPGYSGKLVFTVFNAGPGPVHVENGKPLFLLWLADLDPDAALTDARPSSAGNFTNLPTDLIVPGVMQSLDGLSSKLKDLEKEIGAFQARWKVYGVVLFLVIGILLRHQIAEELSRFSKPFYCTDGSPCAVAPPAPSPASTDVPKTEPLPSGAAVPEVTNPPE